MSLCGNDMRPQRLMLSILYDVVDIEDLSEKDLLQVMKLPFNVRDAEYRFLFLLLFFLLLLRFFFT